MNLKKDFIFVCVRVHALEARRGCQMSDLLELEL